MDRRYVSTAKVSFAAAGIVDHLLWHVLEHASLPNPLTETDLANIAEFREAVSATLNDTDAILVEVEIPS